MTRKRAGRIAAVLLTFVLTLSALLAGGVFSGASAAGAWVEIWTVGDLTAISADSTKWSSQYRLMRDLDLGGASWTPIGTSATPFTGTLDGNGKAISNFSITNTAAAQQGFFGVIGGSGVVSHLTLAGASITAGNDAGILAGENNGTVLLCGAKGTVTGADRVGGLVGSNGAGASISNSYAQAYVSGRDYVGGLVGSNAGTLARTYAASQVESSLFNNYVEFNGGYIRIPHSSAYAGMKDFTLEAWFQWVDQNPSRTDDVNFILSKSTPSSIEWFELHTEGNSGTNGIRFIPIKQNGSSDSYADVRNVMQPGWFHIAAVYQYDEVAKQASARVYLNGVPQTIYQYGSSVGTVMYMNRDTNPLSGNTNDLLIGKRGDDSFAFHGRISDVRVWSTARTQEEISANKNKQLAGDELGLVGYWKLDEASGDVAIDSTGNQNGALVGTVDTIRRVQETASNKGGLVGGNTGAGSVSGSYYDQDVSGLSDAKGTPTTTADMKKAATFVGWNTTNIWNITTDYPSLFSINFGMGAQTGTPVKGVAGSATYALSTVDIPDGVATASFNWFANAGGTAGASAPSGITPSVGAISSNAATVTMTTTNAAAAGTYYFSVSINGMVSDICALTIRNSVYTVRYDANGGSGTTADSSHTYDEAKALTANNFTKTGYHFVGWAASAGGAVQYADGQSVTNLSATDGATVTLYAKWAPNTYTVAYSANGGSGSMASDSHTYDEAKALRANGYTKTGSHFAGWATSAGGAVTYTDGQSVTNLTTTNGAVVTLYAKWTANTYTVAYDANGGSGTTASGSHTYDAAKALTLNGFSRTGYQFAGWATSAGGVSGYTDGQSVTNLTATDGAVVTLYAKWTANSYTVAYDANGGSGTTASSAHTYDTAKNLTANGFAKTGNHFTGWATSAGGAAVYTDAQSVTNLTAANGATVTLYAKWALNSYTVTFDAEGGSVSPASQTKQYGSTYGKGADGTSAEPLPTPSRAGYTFAGWWTGDNATGSEVTDATAVTATNAHTLYAKWTANSYTVAYSANSGSGTTASAGHTYDIAKALTLNGFSRTGYRFAGWATSAGGAVAYADGQSVTNLTAINGATATLYAKWTANSYTVVYDANGGSGTTASTSHTYDIAQALRANGFSKANYQFAGWATSAGGAVAYTDGQSVTNLTAANGATVTLYAKWAEQTAQAAQTGGQRPVTITVSQVPDGMRNANLVTAEAVGNAFDQSVEVRITEQDQPDESARRAIEEGLRELGTPDVPVIPLDISVYLAGTDTRVQPKEGTAVTITYPIPPNLLRDKDRLVVVCMQGGKLVPLQSQLVYIRGVACLQFTATHFSPYAIVVDSTGSVGTALDYVDIPQTGDSDRVIGNAVRISLLGLLIVFCGCIWIIKRPQQSNRSRNQRTSK